MQDVKCGDIISKHTQTSVCSVPLKKTTRYTSAQSVKRSS